MKSVTLLFILIALTGFLSAMGQEEEPEKIELIITPHPYLGVRIGDEMNFYQYSDSLGWKRWGDYVTIPPETDEMIMSSAAQLGIRNGITLRMYSIGLFFLLDHDDSLDFLIPGGADELLLTGGYDLGVRKGRDLKFYTYMNRNWVYNEPYDHSFETDIDEMVLTGNGLLGVRTGNVLKFYNLADKYTYLPQYDFNFPQKPDELVITAQGELGVRNDKEVKFYYYDQEWKHAPNADFHIAPFKHAE